MSYERAIRLAAASLFSSDLLRKVFHEASLVFTWPCISIFRGSCLEVIFTTYLAHLDYFNAISRSQLLRHCLISASDLC